MAPTIINYNVTSVANHSGNKLVKLMQFVSNPDPSKYSIYDYLPGMLILITIAMIIFFSLKIRGHSTVAAFTAMSVANFVLTLLLYPLGVVSGQLLVIGICLLPLSGFLVFLESR